VSPGLEIRAPGKKAPVPPCCLVIMEVSLPAARSPGKVNVPFLEHFVEHDKTLHRIEIAPIPFQIGRRANSHFVIHSHQVSKFHAQIVQADNKFMLVDQNSTNGTFVNRQRINSAPLKQNDIIHIADKELRFQLGERHDFRPSPSRSTANGTQELSSLIRAWEMLKETIRDEKVQAVFQPIINLATDEVSAFELLSRLTHPDLGPNPAAALALAEKLAIAPELSRMFRAVGLREAAGIAGPVSFFFNLHPSEMQDFSFVDQMAETAAKFWARGRQLVLEVHEDANADTRMICRLRELLRKHRIGLAFDDFGAGRSRLMELADAAPDFIKLDMQLVRGIDQSPARQELVRSLGEIAANLKFDMIAEGVETREEADVCKRLGCAYAQGFLFGRPNSANSFSSEHANMTAADTKLLSELRKELSQVPVG
jgi:EAL domain-containing protein (putative c-di-GMP-specific phosphodiesterase class I)